MGAIHTLGVGCRPRGIAAHPRLRHYDPSRNTSAQARRVLVALAACDLRHLPPWRRGRVPLMARANEIRAIEGWPSGLDVNMRTIRDDRVCRKIYEVTSASKRKPRACVGNRTVVRKGVCPDEHRRLQAALTLAEGEVARQTMMLAVGPVVAWREERGVSV